jgi:hypothetical protein
MSLVVILTFDEFVESPILITGSAGSRKNSGSSARLVSLTISKKTKREGALENIVEILAQSGKGGTNVSPAPIYAGS